MTLRIGSIILGLCIATGTAYADKVSATKAAPKPAPGETVENGLIVRANTLKRPTAALRVPSDATGRLLVKIANHADARVRADGRGVVSLVDKPVDCIQAVIDEYGVTVRRAFNQPDEVLLEVEHRAAAISGYAQPRLPSMMYVEGAEANLLLVMKALNDCPDVDWVQPETQLYLHGGGGPGGCCVPDCLICEDTFTADDCAIVGGNFFGAGSNCDACPSTGACCDESDDDPMTMCDDGVESGDCAAFGLRFEPNAECADIGCAAVLGACCVDGECGEDIGQGACLALDGFWAGVGSTCEEDECEVDCGSEFAGDCFDPRGDGTPFCDNTTCCELVCDVDPHCCDTEDPVNFWDELCAATANLLCSVADGADPCLSFETGSCFEVAPEGLAGCSDEGCCHDVCGVDASCCGVTWDENCVSLAIDMCAGEEVDTTPDLTYAQGYLTPGPYPIKPAYLPVPQCDFTWEQCEDFFTEADFGYNGRGLLLQSPLDPHAGVYGAGIEFIEEFGIGQDQNGDGELTAADSQSRGKGVKVAVIEWGFWNGHEDLVVNIEPGQTLLEIGPLTGEFHHGTACLGIINGQENGIGVTGIAPDAEAWFFPLTSVEEGPRFLSAWLSSMQILEPGDVISCSFGPGPPIGNLNNEAGSWTLIRMASDLGLTVCMSAGNDCFNLDDAPDQGNSGGIVVGACSPGVPWYRLPFSNFCTGPTNARGNIVHVKAWGTDVATTGYGDLFAGGADDPDPKRRYYTGGFNGTSAACPQVAGLIACLQGLAKQFYEIPISGSFAGSPSTKIQFLLGAPGEPPGDPTLCELNGGFGDAPCGLDADPEDGPNMIGPYNRGPSEINTLFSQEGVGFPDSPWLGEPQILRGTKLYGNSFSIAADDNSYLVIESDFTVAGTGPDAGGGDDDLGDPVNSPISQIVYIGTGQITDMVVASQGELVNPHSGVTIELEGHTSAVFSLLFVEIYDWNLEMWLPLTNAATNGFFTVMPGQPAPGVPNGSDVANQFFFTNFGARFFHPDTNQILVRCWTYGFGGSIGNVPGFNIGGKQIIRYDFVNYELTSGFGVIPNPP